jgi:hypothetical protein
MRNTLMAASVLALIAGSASAATMTYTNTYNITGPGTGSTTIDGFNGAGTFTSALYTLTYTTNVSGTVKNLDASGTATVDVSSASYKTAPPFTQSNTTGAIAELFAYELDGDSFSLGAGASQAYSLSTSDVQAGVLTALQTATDFSLGYTLFASGGATTSGTSVENIFSATSNLKVEVTYSYEVAAIPVPAATS